MAERTIVNYGVYQFEEAEKDAYRLRVYTQVIRHPMNESLNTKFQKIQSFYGYAQLMNGNHVHQTIPLRYQSECIFEYTASDNLSTFLLSAHTYGVLQSIANLAALHGGSATINPLDPPLYPMPFDRIVFKLFSDTTIVVYTDIVNLPTLEITPALPTDEESDDPEPLSDTEPEENPLDPPYDIPTAPYNPATADNGETYNPQLPPPVYTGLHRCTVVFTNPVIAPGNITYVNNLTDPAPAPVREETVSGISRIVRLKWYYGSVGQFWQIDYTSAAPSTTNQIQIVSSSVTPL